MGISNTLVTNNFTGELTNANGQLPNQRWNTRTGENLHPIRFYNPMRFSTRSSAIENTKRSINTPITTAKKHNVLPFAAVLIFFNELYGDFSICVN